MTYELHPLCTLFPRLAGGEFTALVDDIRANGLRQPIVLHDGMILDGGNRYRACVEAGVKPLFTNYAGTNLVTYVLSANLHRRHLSAGQQAAIVSSAQDWAKAQPAHRPEKAGNVAGLSTVSQRAAQSGAGERTQRMADKVAKANPELAKKVGHGEVSLPKALAQVENKPKKLAPEPDPTPYSDEGAPSIEELMASQEVEDKELEAMRRIFEADDKLGEALLIIKQRDALIEQLQWRINGMVNENAELISSVKSWRRKAEKAA
jgi:hypothetical protein